MIKKKPIPDADQGALIRTHSVFWDALHQHQRFRPQYPNENVVRFLMVHFKQALQGRKILKALDIGVGGGRQAAVNLRNAKGKLLISGKAGFG